MADFYDDGSENNASHSNTKVIPKRKTAIALNDGAQKGEIPEIIASGRGKIAEKILELAYENGINVREDKVLTEMLATIEIDSPIPSEAFMAVAEILSYVYKASGKPNPFDIHKADKADEEGEEEEGADE